MEARCPAGAGGRRPVLQRLPAGPRRVAQLRPVRFDGLPGLSRKHRVRRERHPRPAGGQQDHRRCHGHGRPGPDVRRGSHLCRVQQQQRGLVDRGGRPLPLPGRPAGRLGRRGPERRPLLGRDPDGRLARGPLPGGRAPAPAAGHGPRRPRRVGWPGHHRRPGGCRRPRCGDQRCDHGRRRRRVPAAVPGLPGRAAFVLVAPERGARRNRRLVGRGSPAGPPAGADHRPPHGHDGQRGGQPLAGRRRAPGHLDRIRERSSAESHGRQHHAGPVCRRPDPAGGHERAAGRTGVVPGPAGRDGPAGRELRRVVPGAARDGARLRGGRSVDGHPR